MKLMDFNYEISEEFCLIPKPYMKEQCIRKNIKDKIILDLIIIRSLSSQPKSSLKSLSINKTFDPLFFYSITIVSLHKDDYFQNLIFHRYSKSIKS